MPYGFAVNMAHASDVGWSAFIDIVVDLMFLLDMIIIFNKAYFDEKVFKLVSVRS